MKKETDNEGRLESKRRGGNTEQKERKNKKSALRNDRKQRRKSKNERQTGQPITSLFIHERQIIIYLTSRRNVTSNKKYSAFMKSVFQNKKMKYGFQ